MTAFNGGLENYTRICSHCGNEVDILDCDKDKYWDNDGNHILYHICPVCGDSVEEISFENNSYPSYSGSYSVTGNYEDDEFDDCDINNEENYFNIAPILGFGLPNN